MLQITNEDSGKNEKMSKSLNNFILLHEAIEQVGANTLRMLVLQSHYRSPLVFGEKRLTEAKTALSRIEQAIKNIQWKLDNTVESDNINTEEVEALLASTKEKFITAMDDDFNTSLALAEVFELVSGVNSQIADNEISDSSKATLQKAKDLIVELMAVFGIEIEDSEDGKNLPDELIGLASKFADYAGNDVNEAADVLLNARTEARQNKN